MQHQPPCLAWAEKIALRYEDLSPADQAALDVHLKTCRACQAAQADYHLLDARLHALPPPVIKPFPRLFLPGAAVEETQTVGRRAPAPHRFSSNGRLVLPTGAFPPLLKKALASVLIACLILTLLLFYGSRIINTAGYQLGSTVFTYTRHSDFVDAVAWSPDGRYLASGGWDRTVQVWDAKTGALLFSYQHDEIVDALAWSPDGRYLASGSWDHTVQVWDVQKQRLIRTYQGHTSLVTSVSWSPDGQFIASGSWDDTMQVWYAKTGVLLHTYQYNEIVDSVAWSPDGSTIAISGRDDDVHLINFVSWTQVFDYKGSAHQSCDCVVNVVAWSPDSRYIASGDRDGTVEVWQVSAQKLITTYKGHTADVFALAWSPNGRYLASGGVDHTVQVWLATTGLPLLTYRGHSNDVAALAWSPDSRLIASASWDRTVQVWQATYGS